MAQVSKIIPSVVAKVAPNPPLVPTVMGGRVASGGRHIADVGGSAIEEIDAQGGISYDETAVLFRDYAHLPAGKKTAEPVDPSVLNGLSLVPGALFQIQELASQADQADNDLEGSRIQDISRKAAKVTEAYRGTQEITGVPIDPVGGTLSLRL